MNFIIDPLSCLIFNKIIGAASPRKSTSATESLKDLAFVAIAGRLVARLITDNCNDTSVKNLYKPNEQFVCFLIFSFFLSFSPSFSLRLFTFTLETIRVTMRGSSGPECNEKTERIIIVVVVHDYDSWPPEIHRDGSLSAVSSRSDSNRLELSSLSVPFHVQR